MAKITIDSDHLKKLVEECIELECMANAQRGLAYKLTIQFSETNFPFEYAERLHQSIKDEKPVVSLRYAEVLEAIADGTDVDVALERLAGWL